MDKEKFDFKKIIRNKNFWKQIIKYFGSIALGIGTVYGYFETQIDKRINDRIESYESEKDEHHKSFRQILSETMDVPTDLVPYVITDKLQQLDTLIVDVHKFSSEVLPFVEHQMTWIFPHMEIDPETGEVWWWHIDGRRHAVDDKFGFARIWYGHDWVVCYN